MKWSPRRPVAPPVDPEQVWDQLERATFAVLAYATPAGSPRCSGVLYAAGGHRLYVATSAGSWKARQVKDGTEVAVTVPIRRGGLLSLVAPVPPATTSFRATTAVHPSEDLRIDDVPAKLRKLVPPARRESAVVLALTPWGQFLTYGVGVPLLKMSDPDTAGARVPIR